MSGLLPSEKSLIVNSVIDEFSLNDFTEKHQIGRGSEGEVVRGYNDRLGKVAFKDFKKQVKKTDMNEVIVLAQHSNHPNIIRLFGLLTPEEGYPPNNRSFCIGYIMEHMENGSLFDVIHNTSVTYDMEQVYSWIEKASSGLQYLHQKGVLHRDIKPQNILLGKSLDDLRISDFGLAKVIELQTIACHTGGVGTVDYMAPELHQSQYGKPADIYSLTITFWEIIHRKRPYGYMGQISRFEQICRILKGDRPKFEKEPEISALLIRGWHNNPESRPKISEFIEFARKKRPAQENLRKVVSQQNLPTQDEEEFNVPATVIPKVRLRPSIDVEDLPTNSTEVIVMGGIINGDLTDRIFWLNYPQDDTKKRWIQLPIKLPYKVANHCVVNLHGEVYLFGGMDEKQQACSFLYKLTDQASWERLKDLNSARFHAACVKLNGRIYAIGGTSGSTIYASVECYDPDTNKWTFVRQMNEARASAAAVVQNGKILVNGGFDRNERRLTTFEFYDPGSNVWSSLRLNLPLMTSGHSMIQFNNSIYAYGGEGENGAVANSTSRKYTIDLILEKSQASPADSLCQARSNFASVRFGENLFAIGGWNGKELDSVEIFRQGVWFQYNKLPTSIAGLRAVVATTEVVDKMKEAGNGIDEDEDLCRKIVKFLSEASKVKETAEWPPITLVRAEDQN